MPLLGVSNFIDFERFVNERKYFFVFLSVLQEARIETKTSLQMSNFVRFDNMSNLGIRRTYFSFLLLNDM